MQLRAASFVVASLFLAFGLAAGCGRSALDGYDLGASDGGKDSGSDVTLPDGAPACNPATCPDGCCDENGACQGGGNSLNACGFDGDQCVDCVAQGFDTCDPNTHSCSREITSCDQGSCPNGCCLTTTAGLFCEDGTSPTACGNDANNCVDCTVSGAGGTCDPNLQECVTSICDPSTCSGCCTATGECHTGSDPQFCGEFGALCTDCTLSDGSCVTSDAGVGGTCEPNPPTCTPTSCPTGCCVGPDTCVTPDGDTSCGTGGEQCENCTGEGKVCQAHVCTVIPCATTCATSNGCCAPDGTCHAGFLANACGEAGNACVDCTKSSETCDIATRTCDNTASTCPATYSACPAGAETAAPATSTACTTDDLANAASACTDFPGGGGAGGAHGPGCAGFFSFEQTSNAACGTCLAQFDFTFLEQQGVFACVEPFAPTTPDCNHQTGCATDCTTQSCDACAVADEANCVSDVRTGQCVGFYNRSAACETAAYALGGRFCNPARYTKNDFGLWLQAVGAHYCSD